MPVFRILLDNNIPHGLIPLLQPHEAFHAERLGWAALRNGDLIRAAEEQGFHMLITGDKNIRYQQNLTRATCSIIELSSHQWFVLRANVAELVAAIDTIRPGDYRLVTFPRAPLRRRPYQRLEC
jgi:hypothetical protein